MNLFSYEDLINTQLTHKFDKNYIQTHNNKQYELSFILFKNLLNYIFEKIDNIDNNNISYIINKFNKYISISNTNFNDIDIYSKKCCIYYLYNIYMNNNTIYNIKKIYEDIKNNDVDNLFVNIWSEMSIINLLKNEDDNEKFIIDKDVDELDNNILYEFMINVYMFNLHNVVPNFINTIGIISNPLKFYIKNENNFLTYDIIDNSNSEHIILYDSDFDYNLIDFFKNSENIFDDFINVFLQVYRAMYIANDMINFNHGSLLMKNIYIKNVNKSFCLEENKDIVSLAKNYGHDYTYQYISNVAIITNYKKSSFSIKKDKNEIKLKKISENIGGIYTLTQDILIFLIDIYVFLRDEKIQNDLLIDLLFYIISKYVKNIDDFNSIIEIPLNIYNKSNKLIFSFKNKKNTEIISYFFEYLKNKDYYISYNINNKLFYPNDINMNNDFKYSNINLFNSIINDDVDFKFIYRIHEKEYNIIKDKINDNIKVLKTYEYLKITFDTSGINDDIFEELTLFYNTIMKYIYNLKMYIYYSYATYSKIINKDLNDVLISDININNINYILNQINNYSWTNKKLLKLFNIENYDDKNNIISFINNFFEY